jgi:hypothetical protein
MEDRPLPPEARLDLRIHLDKLRRSQDRCKDGLQKLVEGHMTRDVYLGLLDQHRAAHRAWHRKHAQYFGEAPK